MTPLFVGIGTRCVRLGLVTLFLSLFGFLLQSSGSEASRISQILRDVGRSLEAGNAASFLSYFDRKHFGDYFVLESYADALTRQSEIASSVEVTKIEAQASAYLVEADWILQLRPASTFGSLHTRHNSLKIRFERVKDNWKIVDFQPVKFFRPM